MKKSLIVFIAFLLTAIFHKPILELFANQFFQENNIMKNSDAIIYIPSISNCTYEEIKYLYDNNYSKKIIIIKLADKETSSNLSRKEEVFLSTKDIVLNYINKKEKDVDIKVLTFKTSKTDGFYLQKKIIKYIKKAKLKKVIIVEAPYFAKATKCIFSSLNRDKNLKIEVFSMLNKNIVSMWWKKEKGLLYFFNALYSLIHVKISLLLGII